MAQPQLQSGRMTRFDCLEEFWNYFTFSKSIVRRKKIWQDNRFCWRICFLSKFIFESGKASTTPNAIHFEVFFRSKVFIGGGVADNFYSIQLSSLPPAPTRSPAVELFRYSPNYDWPNYIIFRHAVVVDVVDLLLSLPHWAPILPFVSNSLGKKLRCRAAVVFRRMTFGRMTREYLHESWYGAKAFAPFKFEPY